MSNRKVFLILILLILPILLLGIYNYFVNEFSDAFAKGYFGESESKSEQKSQIPSTNDDILYRICEDAICELGTPSGYINSVGDTIIPIGQFYYCYTDTIKNYGIVLDHSGNCKALNNHGEYLYDVKWYDNGPDYLSDGMFRILKDGKIGYANSKGEIAIEPQFKCASQFNEGLAKVSYDCELINGKGHTKMISESWIYINRRGEKIK
ncbi:WG repeat-containing protein [Reichenbachiella ulvae]|uniref:WG repeat-containing protein n=1 Tax=Reichenbachiella ulvae TaxID=2980104 RepID=A0ABT3CRR7_9BACT|nr:WG repeat-containing protein [Reichenbachiella ulvae]MCV9386184.1 WG repeat-containing protein [Reichenbachiella ulvae]